RPTARDRPTIAATIAPRCSRGEKPRTYPTSLRHPRCLENRYRRFRRSRVQIPPPPLRDGRNPAWLSGISGLFARDLAVIGSPRDDSFVPASERPGARAAGFV